VLCPQEAGALLLQDLRLSPVAAPPGDRPPLATWIWQPDAWARAPGALLDRAEAEGVRTLFLGLDVASGRVRDADALRALNEEAHRRGLRVLAVEGDPAMVPPRGRHHAVARARAIRAYQERAPQAARLDGVQYDIEPYLLPEFDPRDEADLRAWADTYADLNRALDARLDIVLPFWIAGTDEGRRFVRGLSGLASGPHHHGLPHRGGRNSGRGRASADARRGSGTAGARRARTRARGR
jgi:hypothetical protein